MAIGTSRGRKCNIPTAQLLGNHWFARLPAGGRWIEMRPAEWNGTASQGSDAVWSRRFSASRCASSSFLSADLAPQKSWFLAYTGRGKSAHARNAKIDPPCHDKSITYPIATPGNCSSGFGCRPARGQNTAARTRLFAARVGRRSSPTRCRRFYRSQLPMARPATISDGVLRVLAGLHRDDWRTHG